MEWVVAAGLIVILAILLPRLVAATKRSTRGKGRMAGAALALGLAFSVLFDPRKQDVIEQVGKRNVEEEDSEGEDGEDEDGDRRDRADPA